MEFVELNKEEYSEFARTHPLRSFFQTVEMEKLGNYGGWTSYYVGIKENQKIIAGCRMMSYKNRLGYRYFYAPRGFLLDYHNKELLQFFTQNIKQYLKKKKGYMIRIDPTVIHLERDNNGNVISNGENNEDCVQNLKACGYIHHGYHVGYNETVQCRWVYCLDLEGKTEEQLLNEMKATTRNQIKKTLKYGIHIREMNYDELPLFKQITEEASERNHFHDKNLEYYQHMYELFSENEEVKYIVAELHPKEYLTDHPRNEGKKKELKVAIDSAQKKIEKVKKMSEKETIPIAAAMFMIYGDEVLYYHSGNYQQYIDFNGQLMIQWHMIKYGLKQKKKRYNFYGISGVFDSKDPEAGVYEFKKGFGGYVEEYIGDFDLPTSWYYYFQKFIKRR